jgi:hypothetical protein
MDIILIFNGLGNQMSQYAFYLQKYSIHKNTMFLNFCREKNHNGYELEHLFNIVSPKKYITLFFYYIFRILRTKKQLYVIKILKVILKLLQFRIVEENFDYRFKEEYLKKSKGITFFYGGWPSEKHFEKIKTDIQNKFRFPIPTDIQNSSIEQQISMSNSVSIHVRRGDYLDNNNIHLFGDLCGKDYFQEAISLILNKIDSPHFFIFSNDMDWVKSNLQIENVTYVEINQGDNSWKDMYLMSKCKHNIISNSTFSWWGAWLNSYSQKIVIAPDRFLKNDENSDIYPESWIKIKTCKDYIINKSF